MNNKSEKSLGDVIYDFAKTVVFLAGIGFWCATAIGIITGMIR